AAAGLADQTDRLAGLDPEVEPVDDRHHPPAVVEADGQAADFNQRASHEPFTAKFCARKSMAKAGADVHCKFLRLPVKVAFW
ncbi:MAG: hypothetical protein V4490_01705, partial [Pseudomonadota bacterium]